MDVNNTRFTALVNAINNTYSIADYLSSKGIQVTHNHQIRCPLHDDSTPSFSVDTKRNLWKCFGCPDGGKFLSLYARYTNKFLEAPKSIYTLAEELLRSDAALQHEVGFSTIFNDAIEETENFSSESFEQLFAQGQPALKKVDSVSLWHTVKKLKTEPISVQSAFIADCELGMRVEDLIKKYYYSQDIAPTGLIKADAKFEERISGLFGDALAIDN